MFISASSIDEIGLSSTSSCVTLHSVCWVFCYYCWPQNFKCLLTPHRNNSVVFYILLTTYFLLERFPNIFYTSKKEKILNK